MPPKLKIFLQRWLITTLAVLIATQVIPGIEADTTVGLLGASLLLGIFNAVLRPVMLLLSLPLLIVTLGLFTLVINALLLYLVSLLIHAFHITGFWAAFWGALVISLVSLVLNTLTGTGESRLRWQRSPRKPKDPPRGDGGAGPVIDV